MIIESLYIKSFGKLDNVTINLSDGVNILRGENEAGKSTVYKIFRNIFKNPLQFLRYDATIPTRGLPMPM